MENTHEITINFSSNNQKGNPRLVPITEEQRLEAAKKRLEDQEWALAYLKQDWMDEPYLRSLASDLSFKLAGWWKGPADTKYISRALRKIGKDNVWHKDVFGFGVREWSKYNSTTPAWVVQCLIFEQYALGH